MTVSFTSMKSLQKAASDSSSPCTLLSKTTEGDEAYYRANAARFRAAIDAPLMLVAGLRSFGIMEKLVENGEVDMVSLCRPFVREPDLVNRWKQGDMRKADCISCNGCLKYRKEPVRCIQLD